MSRIYEISYSLYSRLYNEYENSDYDNISSYLLNKFLVKNKNGKGYFCIDNTTNEWWEEEFKNKQQSLMWLVDNELTYNEVIQKYNKNKYKFKDYNKYLVSQDVFCEENNIYDKDYFKFDLNKEYDFEIVFHNDSRKFSSTIESAIGLALNYESHLLYKDTLIFSPKGFDFEENYRLIEQYLGKKYIKDKIKSNEINGDFGVPYRNLEDSHFIHLKDEKNIKI